MASVGASVADGADLVLPALRALGGQPGGAQAADPEAFGARPAGGPSLARSDPVRGGWPPSARHSPAAPALPLPRTECAHLRRLRGRPGNYFFSLDAARLAQSPPPDGRTGCRTSTPR